MLQFEKPHSDHAREIYFWRHGREGGGHVTFCSHLTNFTPFWCEWHGWACSEECPVDFDPFEED